MAELISGLWTRLKESQIHVDQRRREDSIFAFQAAAVKCVGPFWRAQLCAGWAAPAGLPSTRL